jgi:APA family basic amino acid/polyamine antiporter
MTALSIAEFASLVSGSVYLYTYSVFGEAAAWTVAWNQIFFYGSSAATESRGLSNYVEKLLKLFGLKTHWLFQMTIGENDSNYICLFPVFYLVFCTFIICKGTEESGKFNSCINIFKLLTIAIIVTISSLYFEKNNFEPFLD